MYGILNKDYSVTPTDDVTEAYNTNKELHHIRQEYVDGYFVSSVFLPLDHSHRGYDGIHFECYVFPAKEVDGEWQVADWGEIWGKRAYSYEQLMAYHDEAIRLIKAGMIKEN